MRPAIFMPLKTRDGVADAPIEPGLRMLCEPCVFGPRWNLWRLIVPAKPLPIPMPATLIVSPGSKASTVTISPARARDLAAELDEVAVRARRRSSFRWPSSAFEIFRSATGSNASSTAS